MAGTQYNKKPISLREGKIFIDGTEVCDSVKCEIKFTPDVWTGKTLGEAVPSSRWLGGVIAGSITARRSNNWLKEIVRKYLRLGYMPEFKIQGIMNDPNSDYYRKHGSIIVTCVGCVLTGDLNLINLDSNGDVLEDTIGFNAKDIIF